MHRKRIFIFCFLLVVMALTTSPGQCENWKEFHYDGDTAWQYDNDSIHYPKQKEAIFDIQNKDIVNVWIRRIEKSGKSGESFMVRVYCTEREWVGSGGWQDPYSKHPSGGRKPIEQGSRYESLFNKVCPRF